MVQKGHVWGVRTVTKYRQRDEFKYCCQRACIEHIVVLLLLITSYGVYYVSAITICNFYRIH